MSTWGTITTVTALRNQRDSYHHGDLRNALCDAATELARRGGPDAVVLREAARRVGVSPTAAYRHFASHGELMHAVKLRCLAELARYLQAALDAEPPLPDPGAEAVRGLDAMLHGYVDFALTETGLFRTAFCHVKQWQPPAITPDPDWTPDELATQPGFDLLARQMDRLAAAGLLTGPRRVGAEVAAWAAAHGLSTLLLDGPLAMLPKEHRHEVIERTFAVLAAGLVGPAPE